MLKNKDLKRLNLSHFPVKKLQYPVIISVQRGWKIEKHISATISEFMMPYQCYTAWCPSESKFCVETTDLLIQSALIFSFNCQTWLTPGEWIIRHFLFYGFEIADNSMCDDFLYYIPHDFCKFFLFMWIIGQPVGCLLFWVYTWPSEVTSYVKYFHIGLTYALHSVIEPVTKIILPHKDRSCCTNLIFMVPYEAVLWQHVQINFIHWFPAVNLLMIFVQIF